MPVHKSPQRNLKKDAKRTARNNFVRATLKTLSKRIHSDIPVEEKQTLIDEIYAQLDKAAKRNVIHARTASRRKSRIALYVNKLLTEKTEQK
jgi:small subunit ribosomal protein S20